MNTPQELFELIKQIHIDCNILCKQILGKYLSVSGNIGVFCQSKEEYELLTKIREELCEHSDNPNQKYFLLKEPIVISSQDDIPETAYMYLYIRKPDLTPYGKYKGDVDFVMDPVEYNKLKERVENGMVPGAEIYDRPGWDTIQLTDPEIDSVGYVSTREFAQKVRAKFD